VSNVEDDRLPSRTAEADRLDGAAATLRDQYLARVSSPERIDVIDRNNKVWREVQGAREEAEQAVARRDDWRDGARKLRAEAADLEQQAVAAEGKGDRAQAAELREEAAANLANATAADALGERAEVVVASTGERLATLEVERDRLFEETEVVRTRLDAAEKAIDAVETRASLLREADEHHARALDLETQAAVLRHSGQPEEAAALRQAAVREAAAADTAAATADAIEIDEAAISAAGLDAGVLTAAVVAGDEDPVDPSDQDPVDPGGGLDDPLAPSASSDDELDGDDDAEEETDGDAETELDSDTDPSPDLVTDSAVSGMFADYIDEEAVQRLADEAVGGDDGRATDAVGSAPLDEPDPEAMAPVGTDDALGADPYGDDESWAPVTNDASGVDLPAADADIAFDPEGG
jgi:hypothetical protein